MNGFQPTKILNSAFYKKLFIKMNPRKTHFYKIYNGEGIAEASFLIITSNASIILKSLKHLHGKLTQFPGN